MDKVIIEKLVYGGQGLAHLNGKAIFVWNALPGEEVEVEYIKNKKNFGEAVTTKILKSSPERIEPKDVHFLSTSPWQILREDKEDEYKRKIAIETYQRIGGETFRNANPDIISDIHSFYHYRNKMEFGFVQNSSSLPKGEREDVAVNTSPISLAFFKRGKKMRTPASGSSLAEPIINKTAQHILAWINTHKIPRQSLKSLIIRSDGRGKSIAVLFLIDRIAFSSYPSMDKNLVGFQLYYSTPKSSASIPTKLLYSSGQDYLITTLNHFQLKFGMLNFFQINIPIFEKVLQDISQFIRREYPLVDYYSGVGSIGLSISQGKIPCILVDDNKEAIRYAKQNIETNNLKKNKAYCAPAEKTLEYVSPDTTVIVDPPRAGLHKKMVERLLEVTPPQIIYLSCDIATQARDVKLLSSKYNMTFHRLYNFFPRTPHIEGLVLLEKK